MTCFRRWGRWGFVGIPYNFLGGLLLGGSNLEKWGDHQKKKFFINNSVEALIPFKEEHQNLLKLPVLFRGMFQCRGKKGLSSKEGILFEAENNA